MNNIPDTLMACFIAIACGAIAGAFIIGYHMGKLRRKLMQEIFKARHEIKTNYERLASELSGLTALSVHNLAERNQQIRDLHILLTNIDKQTSNSPVRGRDGQYHSRKNQPKTFRDEANTGNPGMDTQKG